MHGTLRLSFISHAFSRPFLPKLRVHETGCQHSTPKLTAVCYAPRYVHMLPSNSCSLSATCTYYTYTCTSKYVMHILKYIHRPSIPLRRPRLFHHPHKFPSHFFPQSPRPPSLPATWHHPEARPEHVRIEMHCILFCKCPFYNTPAPSCFLYIACKYLCAAQCICCLLPLLFSF